MLCNFAEEVLAEQVSKKRTARKIRKRINVCNAVIVGHGISSEVNDNHFSKFSMYSSMALALKLMIITDQNLACIQVLILLSSMRKAWVAPQVFPKSFWELSRPEMNYAQAKCLALDKGFANISEQQFFSPFFVGLAFNIMNYIHVKCVARLRHRCTLNASIQVLTLLLS